MGNYGTGTTCGLCFGNHPTRSDAVTCADSWWKRAGFAGFRDDTEDGPTVYGEIVHEPTPAITADEIMDYASMTPDAWTSAARSLLAMCDPV